MYLEDMSDVELEVLLKENTGDKTKRGFEDPNDEPLLLDPDHQLGAGHFKTTNVHDPDNNSDNTLSSEPESCDINFHENELKEEKQEHVAV